MRKFGFVLACASALSLASCGTLGTVAGVAIGGPQSVANDSKLDEQVGLTVTLAYTAAARAAGLAISTGVVKDAATIKRIGELDRRAFAAVKAVRDAYVAVNSTAYLSALSQARAAVADLLAAIRGPVASIDADQLPAPGPGLARYAALFGYVVEATTYLNATNYRLAQAYEGKLS